MGENDFLKKLRDVAGAENFFTDRADLVACSASPTFGAPVPPPPLPLAAVRPANLADAREIFDLCKSRSVGVALRGGATRAFRPEPKGPWIVLLTSGLNRILDIDPENGLASVQAGVLWGDLDKALAAKNLRFPPVSVDSPLSTVGGSLSVNAACLGGRKYGSINAWVRELEVIDGSGRRFVCHFQNGSPGALIPSLPACSLFCGANGCLGLIGAAALNVSPAPEKTSSLVAVFDDELKAAKACARLAIAAPAPDQLVITNAPGGSLQGDARPRVAVAYAGTTGDAAAGVALARDLFKSFSVLEMKTYDGWREAAFRPAALARLGPRWLFLRLSGPIASLPAQVEALADAARRRDLRYAFAGQPGDLRVALFGENAALAARELFVLELTLNNRLESEEDLNLDRETWLKRNGPGDQLSAALRRVFDPDGVLSPQPLPDGDGLC